MMDIIFLEQVLSYANLVLEFIAIIFITFVFFDLVYLDRSVHLSNLSEKFEKFKRYDVFKSSLIFLVLNLYFVFFAKMAIFLDFPNLAFTIFTFIANIFLILFVVKLYNLLHKYTTSPESQ